MSNPPIIDISNRVGPGYRTRAIADLDGIAVHHTVSGGDWGSFALDRTDEERVNHALAIDAWHRSLDYGGIGYDKLIFANGLITYHGPLTQQRAGVAHHNRHLVSFAYVGDLTDGRPTDEALASGAWLIADYWRQIGEGQFGYPPGLFRVPVKGHTDWNTDPAWATACPGRGYERWMPDLIAMAVEEDIEEMNDTDRAWVLQFIGGRKLVRGNGPDVYIVDQRGKRPFPGNEVLFVAVGFRWEDVIGVSDGVLAAIPDAD